MPGKAAGAWTGPRYRKGLSARGARKAGMAAGGTPDGAAAGNAPGAMRRRQAGSPKDTAGDPVPERARVTAGKRRGPRRRTRPRPEGGLAKRG